ncbi:MULTISPECIES: DUF4278 domain-containing protein [Arthrospira]|jgi:hypothetical protein|uniref:DUF4278 domain-containing protein n=1 Tax=Limnospira platensis NIES-46 TaxID=1236695 RepID=A0A5M3T3J9_LIMPL|nr:MULTISPECIES: DUF4278 domain-containing protein [Arthrospira]AMW28886.1 hypothetical protein AP285_13870 [Arthrospira platensis YZ]KDR56004.1 hypothetical protein APPUASWS_019290 [Arthrospira platensis str. Paraca]MBD2669788.1 DUF4278 domain-containing protein [Arthrospira platensis FACHB-439]MBD2710351.1 DUF4278 domain-containing protein [Arthrospira platensis FACHB-835]MDF2212637.1 DUF4278 domain-containing protein [Arthrospira platensis NCB002]MDT9183014.1 DUF4278 domain-containing prot
MGLTYRGVSYSQNTESVETTVGQVGGKYRGQDWRFRNLKKAPVLQPSHNLTYRGVKYSNNPEAVATPSQTPLSVADRSRELILKQQRSTWKREKSMFNRLADQVGLDSNSAEIYNPAW